MSWQSKSFQSVVKALETLAAFFVGVYMQPFYLLCRKVGVGRLMAEQGIKSKKVVQVKLKAEAEVKLQNHDYIKKDYK